MGGAVPEARGRGNDEERRDSRIESARHGRFNTRACRRQGRRKCQRAKSAAAAATAAAMERKKKYIFFLVSKMKELRGGKTERQKERQKKRQKESWEKKKWSRFF